MQYSQKLKDFVCVYKDRIIKISKTKDQEELLLKELLLSETSWLDTYNPTLTTRFHIVLNDIFEAPKCANPSCNNLTSIEKEYMKSFSLYCSSECKRTHSKIIIEKDWLFQERIIKKKSIEDIAKDLNCSITPVRKWMRIHNIPEVNYTKSDPEVQLLLQNKDWMTEEHKNKRLNFRQIAKNIGSSSSTVQIAFESQGITPNKSNSYPRKIQKTSKGEKEIVEFIRGFYPKTIKTSERTLLNGRELDILLPEDHLAIEYNGVWNHLYRPECETFAQIKSKNYHVSKTNLCEEQGIHLLQIWSSSWETKQNIWKSIIRTKLGLVENKIYARKCDIKDVVVHEKNNFLDENHLQGKDKSKIKLGMYDGNNLVALMTFGVPRYSTKQDWELIRFCVRQNCSVVGGFSRLLSHFRNNYSGSIVSYADRLYSNGGVYQKNGFQLTKVNRPAYWYVPKNSEKLIHRSRFRKQNISTPSNREQTESQIMENLGYRKIFDCGTKTYVLS